MEFNIKKEKFPEFLAQFELLRASIILGIFSEIPYQGSEILKISTILGITLTV